MIKHITLVLGDNDFGITFTNMLKVLHNLLKYRADVTEQQMTVVIKEGIYFHYMAFQHLDDSNKDNLRSKEVEDTVKYLQSSLKIYYNEEACAMCSTDWDSGAWHLDVTSGHVSYL